MNERDARLEQALEALFGDGHAQADAGELARVRAELGAVREALREHAFARPRDEARLVARVLARTTREDLSWRGDVRLALDFVRARLRASRALRWVAASLALHLVAAPAVALWVLYAPEPERGLTIRVEPARESPFAEELETPARVPDELLEAARAREARENARAAERFALQAHGRGLLPLVLPGEASPEFRLLAGRFEGLRAGLHGRPAPAPEAAPPATPLGRWAWLESELDRAVLSRESGTLAARRAAAEWAESSEALDPALLVLRASFLRRAWAEGWIEEAPDGPAIFAPEWWDALVGAARANLSAEEAECLRAWCADARGK